MRSTRIRRPRSQATAEEETPERLGPPLGVRAGDRHLVRRRTRAARRPTPGPRSPGRRRPPRPRSPPISDSSRRWSITVARVAVVARAAPALLRWATVATPGVAARSAATSMGGDTPRTLAAAGRPGHRARVAAAGRPRRAARAVAVAPPVGSGPWTAPHRATARTTARSTSGRSTRTRWCSSAGGTSGRPRAVDAPEAMALATADADGPPVGADGAAQVVGRRRLRLLHQLRRAQEPRSRRQSRGRPALLLGAPRPPGPHRGIGRPGPPTAESDAYYATRDVASRIGAYASHQSRPIADRAELDAAVAALDGRVRRTATCPGRRGGEAGGSRPGPSSSGSRATTGSTTGSATSARRAGLDGSSGCSPDRRRRPAPARPAGAGGRYVRAMADDTTLVEERTTQLLEELDPTSVAVEEFRGRQFDLGLAWISFPEGSADSGLPPNLQRIVDRRLAEAGATPAGAREFFGLTMAGPTVVTHGSDELRDRLLRRTFTGEESWCQLFSEPGSGSDLAGLATRAVRDGDEWVITGQKVWNTLAHIADRGMLVARTDPEAPKHKGLTYFALDMHAPGRRGAPAPPDDRRGRVQRGLPDRGPGARRRPDRRRGRGLAGGHDHPVQRADHHRRRGRRPAAGVGLDRRGRPDLPGRGCPAHRRRAGPAHAAVDRDGGAAADQHAGLAEPQGRATPAPRARSPS